MPHALTRKARQDQQRLRQLPVLHIAPVLRHSSKFSDNQKKDLTRRANQGYNNIIARTDKARAEKSAAGFLFAEIPIRRRPHVTTPHLLARRQSVASVPPPEPCTPLAGTRERAGARGGTIGRHRAR